MTEAEARERLGELTTGYARTQAVFAVAELGIADLIANGTTSIDELASASGTRREPLFRLLRFLVGEGVFDLQDGVYSLTPVGELLRSDAPSSRRSGARMMGRFLPAWGEIVHSLRTGESGFEKAYGTRLFDHMTAYPEDGAIFDAVMTEVHGKESAPISRAYDFESFRCLADIGGGNGSLMIEILTGRPDLTGIVFDRPDVAERASERIAEAGLSGRLRAEAGDFFRAAPEGADGHLLRHIIHDWTDDECTIILEKCRAALPPDGRILVAEAVVPEGNEPALAKSFDLSMMVIAGGKERTEAEYRALYDRAGFELTRIVPTNCPVSLIEGRPRS